MEEHLCYSTDVSETDDTASVGYITSLQKNLFVVRNPSALMSQTFHGASRWGKLCL